LNWGIEDLYWIRLVAFSGFLILLTVAVIFDLRYRRIPNWVNLSLLAIWAAAAISASLLFDGVWKDFAYAGLVALIVLLVSIGMFFLRAIGGGDAKMLAAVALWMPPGGVTSYLIAVILTGGLVSLVTLLWSKGNESRDKRVPYGVAIAFGGLWVCAQTFFSAK